MDRAEIEKFKRNSGQGKIVKIGDADFYFKPLRLKHLPELIGLSQLLNEDSKNALQKNTLEMIFNILQEFVKNSYPELDEEQRELFIVKNFIILTEVMIEISIAFADSLTDTAKENIEKMKREVGGD